MATDKSHFWEMLKKVSQNVVLRTKTVHGSCSVDAIKCKVLRTKPLELWNGSRGQKKPSFLSILTDSYLASSNFLKVQYWNHSTTSWSLILELTCNRVIAFRPLIGSIFEVEGTG